MPWFKVDDGFHGHPKVVELSLSAVGLWTLAGSWCAHYLTDGYVSAKTVARLGGDAPEAEELMHADLWLPAEVGYRFKDWEHYQPLKETVEAERLAAQERMRKVRAAKKGVRPNDEGTSGEVPVAPSHPIPSRPSSSTKKTTTAARGSRLDPAWLPPSDEVARAKNNYAPHVDLKAEHEVFVDYWVAQAGAKGVKADWLATWRNWMRRKESDWLSRPAGKLSPEDRLRQTLALGSELKELR